MRWGGFQPEERRAYCASECMQVVESRGHWQCLDCRGTPRKSIGRVLTETPQSLS